MTPCEKLGYQVGDLFEALERSSWKKGTILVLIEDDESNVPLFRKEGSRTEAYEELECVKPLHVIVENE